jgi:hypothetical protein
VSRVYCTCIFENNSDKRRHAKYLNVLLWEKVLMRHFNNVSFIPLNTFISERKYYSSLQYTVLFSVWNECYEITANIHGVKWIGFRLFYSSMLQKGFLESNGGWRRLLEKKMNICTGTETAFMNVHFHWGFWA